jgi:arginine decarboxylase
LKKGEEPRLPDPDKVRIRVYATQSTHKTLTSFRQGSMIHIWDEDFERKSEASFHEAYMTHTSTSANYQILASMDVGRRQVEFEGYELVEKAIELGLLSCAAPSARTRALQKWFDIITIGDLVPAEHRQSGLEHYYRRDHGWNAIEKRLGRGRVRRGPHQDQPVHRQDRHRRRHLQEQVLDGQAPDPDQQDLAATACSS